MGSDTYCFGDCASLIRDNVHPKDANGMPYIGLEHIEEGSLCLIDSGKSEDVTSTKLRFRKGDILFGKLRPYFRKVIRAPFDGVCSTEIWVVRTKPGVDQGYLYYWMASQSFVDFSMQGSEGTRMPRAKWEHVIRHEQPKLKFYEQQAIAYILGTLDDKIELNRKMNNTLETVAQAIFKSWFVDYDPVRAKVEDRQQVGIDAESASLFPDSFEESEMGMIPKGWKVGTLGSLCEKPQYGYTASAEDDAVGPLFLRIKDINKRPWVDWENVPYCQITASDVNKYRLQQGDLVVARMADPGHAALIEEDKEAVFASYLIRFRIMRYEHQRYLQYWVRSKRYWDLIHGRKTGTTRANLNAKVLANLPILIPDLKICQVFSQIASAIRMQIVHNVSEIETISRVRNTLLPRLLSGEIRIKDAEKFIEKVA